MIEELTRTMNDDERSLITSWVTNVRPLVTLRDTVKWCLIWSAGLICCALLIAYMMRFELSPAGGAILGVIVIGPVAIFGIVCLCALFLMWSSYFHWSGIHRKFMRYDLPEIRQALLTGMVSVRKIKTTSVIELAEFEDEGSGYVFDIGDGKVLFLKGQQYFPVNEEMPWPSTEFEIVHTYPGDRWVGIFCHGEKLVPVQTVELSVCREDVVWDEREEVAEGDPESFVKSLMAT